MGEDICKDKWIKVKRLNDILDGIEKMQSLRQAVLLKKKELLNEISNEYIDKAKKEWK